MHRLAMRCRQVSIQELPSCESSQRHDNKQLRRRKKQFICQTFALGSARNGLEVSWNKKQCCRASRSLGENNLDNLEQVLDLENFEWSTALRHAIDAMLGLIASYEYLTSSFLHRHGTVLSSSSLILQWSAAKCLLPGRVESYECHNLRVITIKTCTTERIRLSFLSR